MCCVMLLLPVPIQTPYLLAVAAFCELSVVAIYSDIRELEDKRFYILITC